MCLSRTYADVSHAKHLLGYEPRVSLAEGVRRFLQWYAAYYKIELPAAMTPTHKEQLELQKQYNIRPPKVPKGRLLEGAQGHHPLPHAKVSLSAHRARAGDSSLSPSS